MLIGNIEARNIFQKYISQAISGDPDTSQFFLLSGPSNIGKASFAYDISKSILGDYISSNLLHIKDFSSELGKSHSIKIQEDQNEDYKTLKNDQSYTDLGVREINEWLQKSGFGIHKILIIENIERMTIGAINAFLKNCEEPISNRIIIATTSNKQQLLDTVLSRAIMIPFQELSQHEMIEFARENNILQDNLVLQEILISMSMGRPGYLLSLSKLLIEDPLLAGEINQITKILSSDANILQKQKILSKLSSYGILDQFLDGWISYTTSNGLIEQSYKWLNVKKMLETNVSVDNLILYGLLN